jgi:hypothetical protein
MVAVGQTGGFAPGTLDLFLKLYQVITSASNFLTITFIGSSTSFEFETRAFCWAVLRI